MALRQRADAACCCWRLKRWAASGQILGYRLLHRGWILSDEDRFTELCRCYQHRIAGYALRRTGNAADAADVTAEVFLVAWRRIADVPGGDGALPWLYATARRTLANHRRGDLRRSQLATRLADQLPNQLSTPEALFPDDLAAAREAFQSLDEADRELLSLIGWEDLGRDTVAEILGCSRTAVRVRLHRARRRFAASLAACGIDHYGRPTSVPASGRRGQQQDTEERTA